MLGFTPTRRRIRPGGIVSRRNDGGDEDVLDGGECAFLEGFFNEELRFLVDRSTWDGDGDGDGCSRADESLVISASLTIPGFLRFVMTVVGFSGPVPAGSRCVARLRFLAKSSAGELLFSELVADA